MGGWLHHGEANRSVWFVLGLQPLSWLPRHPAVQDRLRWTALSSLPDSGRPSDPRQAAEAKVGWKLAKRFRRKLRPLVVQVSRLQGYLPGGSGQAVLRSEGRRGGSDWSSDVFSSDLSQGRVEAGEALPEEATSLGGSSVQAARLSTWWKRPGGSLSRPARLNPRQRRSFRTIGLPENRPSCPGNSGRLRSFNQFGRSAFSTCGSNPSLLSRTDPGGLLLSLEGLVTAYQMA